MKLKLFAIILCAMLLVSCGSLSGNDETTAARTDKISEVAVEESSVSTTASEKVTEEATTESPFPEDVHLPRDEF